jgi:hypothetical protein
MKHPMRMVRRAWTDVVVVASGPSRTQVESDIVIEARERQWVRVVVVNREWSFVPNADVLYAADWTWWNEHIGAVRAAGFAGELWTQAEPAARKFGLSMVLSRGRPGLTASECLIHFGGNSGYQAVNLAYLFGARRIALVGFDFKRVDERAHHWGNYSGRLDRTPKGDFSSWINRFAVLAKDARERGVDLVNCSPNSALEGPRRAPLAETLERWREQPLAA